MRGRRYFRVDLGLTDSLVDRMLDTGRVLTMGWKTLAFAFVLKGQKPEDRMQIMGDERVTDVLVDVPSGAHSKSPRT